MPFRPNVGDTLLIDEALYSIAEHPAARGMPYGQEGRAAVVYQLVSQEGRRALKAFKPRYQVPSLVNLSERLAAFATIPGLQVCKRSVLTARRHIQLVREHRDLSYAVLMPWVEGPTWMEALQEKTEFSPEQSLSLARALVEILSNMEERGLAHCDLSGPNLMLPILAPSYSGSSPIELVDVEQMYGEELKRPDFITSGSSGYGHKNMPDGLWAANADRFAGALLISEMLGWCDERVREAAWGESYFAQDEMQEESTRFKLLVSVVEARWGSGIAHLLEQAWQSDSLSDCAPFGHWLAALPDQASPEGIRPDVEAVVTPDAPTIEHHALTLSETVPQVSRESRDLANALLEEAKQYEDEGNLTSALATYRELQSLMPTGSSMADELAIIIGDLEKGRRAVGGPPSPVSSDDPKLAALFDSALAAYRQAEWASAQELLAEVVRRKPNYQRNGREASKLLATAEKRAADRFLPTLSTTIAPVAPTLASTQPVTVQAKEKRGLNWLLVPGLVVAALLLFGGIMLFQTQFPNNNVPGGGAELTALAKVSTAITGEPTAMTTTEPTAMTGGAMGMPEGCSAVELNYWTPFTGPDGPFMQTIVDNFNTANPTIKVTMNTVPGGEYSTQLGTAAASDTLPDVATINEDQVATQAFRGVLRPLGDAEKAIGYTAADFPKVAWDAGTVAGKQYALPLSFVAMTQYYNQDMLTAAGIDKAPATKAEFEAAAAAMTKDGNFGFLLTNGFPVQQIFQQLLHQYGGTEFSADGTTATWNSEAGVKALTWMKDAQTKYGQANLEVDAELNAFKFGMVGMVWNGIWQIPNVTGEAVEFKGMAGPVPQIGDQPAVWAGGPLLAFPAKKSPDACKDAAGGMFIKYVLDNSIEWAKAGSIPAANKVRESAEFKALPHSSVGPSVAANPVFPPSIPGIGDAFAPLGNMLYEVMSGTETDIKKALDSSVENANAILQENKTTYGDAPMTP